MKTDHTKLANVGDYTHDEIDDWMTSGIQELDGGHADSVYGGVDVSPLDGGNASSF